MNRINEFGQEISYDLTGWQPPAFPEPVILAGSYVRLEPLEAEKHASQLYDAYRKDNGAMWTYTLTGPYQSLRAYYDWVVNMTKGKDPQFYALIDLSSAKALGVASYLRIDPKAGSIEVGHIAYAPELQKTRQASEAMYLMMKHAFDLGYRRYEWKCDALNKKSRQAALRLGFQFEGVFRQATHYKGRNRDTAWFAVIDKDWPLLESAFTAYLAEENFDLSAKQKCSLMDLRKELAKISDYGS